MKNEQTVNLTIREILTRFSKNADEWEKIRAVNSQYKGLYRNLHTAQGIDYLLAPVTDGVVFGKLTGRVNNESAEWLPNAGDIGECLVKWFDAGFPDYVERSPKGAPDFIDKNGKEWEVKTSLANGAKCTRVQGDRDVILVNKRGFFKIAKEDLYKYVDRQGRLPADEKCGTRWDEISDFFEIDGMRLSVKA